MIMLGYYVFTLEVRVSICLSVRASFCLLYVCIFFQAHNLSKYQWIFTQLGMCIDVVEIIDLNQLLSKLSARHTTVVGVLSFHVFIHLFFTLQSVWDV